MSELDALLQEILFGKGLMLSIHLIQIQGRWRGLEHWTHADRDFIFPAANGRR